MLYGTDGRLSFSKVTTWLVLALYAAGVALPVPVAIVAICSAHGGRYLMAIIQRTTLGAQVVERVERVRATVERITKRRAATPDGTEETP